MIGTPLPLVSPLAHPMTAVVVSIAKQAETCNDIYCTLPSGFHLHLTLHSARRQDTHGTQPPPWILVIATGRTRRFRVASLMPDTSNTVDYEVSTSQASPTAEEVESDVLPAAAVAESTGSSRRCSRTPKLFLRKLLQTKRTRTRRSRAQMTKQVTQGLHAPSFLTSPHFQYTKTLI